MGRDAWPNADGVFVPGLSALVLFALAVASFCFPTWTNQLTALLLAATCAAAVWYTHETWKQRKIAEADRARWNLPVIHVALEPYATPAARTTDSEDGLVRPDRVWVTIQNVTQNLAFARVAVRAMLKANSASSIDTEETYSGVLTWVLWPAENFRGWTSFERVLEGMKCDQQDEGGFECVALEIQVAVYDSDGNRRALIRREYNCQVRNRRCLWDAASFYPEVAVKSFARPHDAPEVLTMDNWMLDLVSR